MKPIYQHVMTGLITTITLLGFMWVFVEPKANEIVDNRVDSYIKSDEYNDAFHKRKFLEYIRSPDFEKELESYLTENSVENTSISFRKLLSIKMKMEPEDVADAIGKMYNEDRKRLRNLLRAINTEYPWYNVWQIE